MIRACAGISGKGLATIALVAACAVAFATPLRAQQPEKRRGRDPGLIQQMTAFKTDVPAHDLDVVLVRPTDRSITVSIAVAAASQAVVEYWRDGAATRRTTPPAEAGPGAIANVELTGLEPGAAYRYRVGLSRAGAARTWGPESRFRTRPSPGAAFTFVVQADSHLDQNVEPAVYERTLANMLQGEPDFVIDLGDTFMTDKRGKEYKGALAQYDAQRFYLGQIARSAPLFMVLGNHDGEKGSSGREPEDIGPWSFRQRTGRFPAPVIDGRMYTGATTMNEGVGANYYAFEWGDALFVVLDPFWSTTERIKGNGGGGGGSGGGGGGGGKGGRGEVEVVKPSDASWAMTLGRAQYDWLDQTLTKSQARFRFVFIHHLVGGIGGVEARGGVESSGYFEWGGKNADGTDGFAAHRPKWPLPIHDLLVKHHVSAVFHGHDHLYVHNERDGLVYQCVAQPGNPPSGTSSAAAYGYLTGTILGSPGHVRVRVTPNGARIEFVRTVAGETKQRGRRGGSPREENGAVVDSYEIVPQGR